MSTELVMGAAAAATDLIGRRVQVWIADGSSSNNGPQLEGPVHAVGQSLASLVMWVLQTRKDRPYFPEHELVQCGGGGDRIVLLPVEPG